MTETEIQALMQIISRAPMSQAENLWVGALMGRLILRARAAAAALQAAEEERTPQPDKAG